MAFIAPFPGGNKVTGSNTFNSGGANLTSYSASLGAADPTRIIVVCVIASSAVVVSGVTIAGIAATEVANSVNVGNSQCTLWAAAVPTGTTGTISFSASGQIAIRVYAIYGARSATPNATATTQTNGAGMTLSCPAGSFIIAAGGTGNSTNSASWTGGVAVDGASSFSLGWFTSSASGQNFNQGNQSPACTFGSPSNPAFAAAVWGP